MIRRWGLSSRLALGILALAMIFAVVAGLQAWRLRPLPDATRSEIALAAAPERAPRGGVANTIVLEAVARDPFRPDRTRPAHRYQLPGERETTAKNRLSPAVSRMRLVGTARLSGDVGLAAIEIPGQPARVMRVGETVEGLTLISVARGSATFAGADTTLTLGLPGALARRQTP